MIDTGPNTEAFIAGLQMGLLVLLTLIAALAGVAIVRRILGA